jgi:hypothetical protein
MLKPRVQILALISLGLCASGARAAQNDPLTRLPVYPETEYASSDTQNVCGTKVQDATYSARSDNLATVDRWYAAHFRGFSLIHGTNRDYPYDAFVRPDDTLSVSVLGSGPNEGVEAIVYHRNAKPANASNLTNWLDGGDPICK